MTRKSAVLRVIRILLLAGAALSFGGIDVACSSSSGGGGCSGVVIEGKCEKKCVDSACVQGTRCITDALNNACVHPCKTQDDCPIGENCQLWQFSDGRGSYCVRLPYTKGGRTGEYESCTADTECDQKRGFRCISGTCQVPCKSPDQCSRIGTVCKPGEKDTSGKSVSVCIPDHLPRAPGQFGSACPDGSKECDAASDFACITQPDQTPYCSLADCTQNSQCPAGETCTLDRTDTPPCQNACGLKGDSTGDCAAAADIGSGKKYECGSGTLLRHYCEKPVPCTTSADCMGIGVCGLGKDANGNPTHVCVPDGFPRGSGQFGTLCPNGKSDCDTKSDFTCIGQPGSTDAYCSLVDCTSDSDCPSDYFCSLQRTGTPPCQSTCGLQGSSSGTCAAAADIGPGKKYQCGPLSLLRHYCLKRDFCNACKTDADCGALPNQVCADDGNGNKYCTIRCDPATNSCPWGTAATCGVWDKTLGFATCRHRFGACTGTGKGCDPCIDDSDCGSNGLCLVEQFTGEHYCVNLNDTCSCPAGSTTPENPMCNGGGCPDTPGGLPGSCDALQTFSDGSPNPFYDHCVGADINASVIGGSPQTGCWPH